MADSARVLLIEDNPADAALVRQALAPGAFELIWHGSIAEAQPALASDAADVVLLDLSLGDSRGLETLERVHAMTDMPIVVLSGLDDEELALRAVRSGAQDFLVKGGCERALLGRSLRYAIERKRLRDEIHQLNADLDSRVRARTAELATANRELEGVLHSIAHDLRAPLRALHGFAEILVEDYGEALDAVGHDYLWRVQEASERLEATLDGLLQLDRVGRAELRPRAIDLTAFVDKLSDDLGGVPGLLVQPGLRAVADPLLLHAILSQLLENARTFTAGCPAPSVRFGVDPAHPAVYQVRDNGVGLPEGFGDQLFEPFRRLHAGEGLSGPGLGLAIAARAVHRHGGRIWGEGAPGKGTTISFTLGA